MCTYYARKVCVNVICNHAAFFMLFYMLYEGVKLLTKFFFTKKIIMSSFDYLHEIDEIYTNLFFCYFFCAPLAEKERGSILFFYKQKVTRRSRKMGYL